MNNYNNRIDDRPKEEKPPYSKIFILYHKDKDLREQDFRDVFDKFGEIEDVYMPRDRNTGESRGMAYVKYKKTSSAAAAIEEMHLKPIGSSKKQMKVLLATNRNDKNDNTGEKCSRLFIKTLKQATESDIEQHFSQFAKVDAVFIHKDKNTRESRGLAYVQFPSFLDAAKAFENCDKNYRAVFATPKQELKRGRENDLDSYCSSASSHREYNHDHLDMPAQRALPWIKTAAQHYKTVSATCTPGLPQRYLERLFNIVPGLQSCDVSDSYNNFTKAIFTYDDERSAAFAVERLNNYEFPSGEIVLVKPHDPLSNAADNLSSIVNSFKNAVDTNRPDLLQLADAIAQASSLIKAATSGRADNDMTMNTVDSNCNVGLPPVQPLADPQSKVAQRCFLVFKPKPPPVHILKDAFSRFGDLIDIISFPNKTFGYAKYASARAAQEAMNTLHGAILYGVKLKVLEAEERPKDSEDIDMQTDADRKRMKLDD